MVHSLRAMAYRTTERALARRLAVRERILRTAHALVAQGGFGAAPVAAVAAGAGVATGSVYRHFASKADLFAEVFRRGSEREMAVLAGATAADGRPVAERIAAAIEAFARRALAAPVRAYAFIAEPVDPEVEQERLVFRREIRDLMMSALDEGIASGELRPHDTETLGAALVGALGEALVGPLSPAANGG